jgi:hypothetical protein
MRSPISRMALGECNAITNDALGTYVRLIPFSGLARAGR